MRRPVTAGLLAWLLVWTAHAQTFNIGSEPVFFFMLAGLGFIGLVLRRASNCKRTARTCEAHAAV